MARTKILSEEAPSYGQGSVEPCNALMAESKFQE